MGKQGPCYHCGVTSTPLWRNGPPDKPVLCNACGSRWRTKGTLANYTPLHLRAEPEIFEDHRISRVKFVSGNKNREPKLLKRKQYNDNVVISGTSVYKQDLWKVVDEDTSNRSSSGSAISNSESCVQFGGAEAIDMSGPSQSVVWDTLVPSKKRTCVSRSRPSSIEKLTKDLHTILHEQRQSSYLSGLSEEDLLYESEIPMVSVEIGHGSVLIKHPNSISREEESEASSLSFDHKANRGNEAYSRRSTFSVHNGYNGVKCQISGMAKDDRFPGQGVQQDQMRCGNVHLGRLAFVGNHNSALCAIDIKDIFNFEEFARSLTSEEQQNLLKFLPPVDFAMLPDSLRGMFESPQFIENLISFQHLLSEGLFDDSLLGMKDEDRKTLKRLALSNFAKSKWVEHYSSLKKCKNGSASFGASGQPCTIASNLLETVKRSCDGEDPCFSETKHKSPKRTMSKASSDTEEFVDMDGSDYTPTSVFALPHSSSSFMLDSFNFTDDGHDQDQDLLLDVPSNYCFPQAELLPTSSFGATEASASSHVSSVPDNARWRFH